MSTHDCRLSSETFAHDVPTSPEARIPGGWPPRRLLYMHVPTTEEPYIRTRSAQPPVPSIGSGACQSCRRSNCDDGSKQDSTPQCSKTRMHLTQVCSCDKSALLPHLSKHAEGILSRDFTLQRRQREKFHHAFAISALNLVDARRALCSGQRVQRSPLWDQTLEQLKRTRSADVAKLVRTPPPDGARHRDWQADGTAPN